LRPISRFISKTVQDTAIVTMEDEWELLCDLWNNNNNNNTVKRLIQAGSQIEAGSPIQAGGSGHEKPGACIISFTVIIISALIMCHINRRCSANNSSLHQMLNRCLFSALPKWCHSNDPG